MPETPASCEPLDWDTEFFGFTVAQVVGSTLDEGSARGIDEWCAKRGIRCLYFLADADDAETLRVACDHDYRQVDVRIGLRHDLDPLPEGTGVRIRDALPGDVEELAEIARRSHRDSRFYHDGRFPRERCDELYATWIVNGADDPSCWTLVAELDGSPAGYQLISPPGADGIASMRILAVDETQRRRGVGRALLAAGLRRAHGQGASAVDTATQERNAASLRAHHALGFRRMHSAVWFHKWFEP
jgi:dTDP-4-amino-4,6-dideoxy-D-galactose acyltransferase